MPYAQVVLAYYKRHGYWPEFLICDPIRVHQIAFEMANLYLLHPDCTPIRLVHNKWLSAGKAIAANMMQLISLGDEYFEDMEPYEPIFIRYQTN